MTNQVIWNIVALVIIEALSWSAYYYSCCLLHDLSTVMPEMMIEARKHMTDHANIMGKQCQWGMTCGQYLWYQKLFWLSQIKQIKWHTTSPLPLCNNVILWSWLFIIDVYSGSGQWRRRVKKRKKWRKAESWAKRSGAETAAAKPPENILRRNLCARGGSAHQRKKEGRRRQKRAWNGAAAGRASR